MSRLRRLAITEKLFFVTCNLLRTRTELTDPDFKCLSQAIARVRERRRFALAGFIFMPDHWHALISPAQGDDLPNLMNAIKVAAAHAINRSRRKLGNPTARGPLWQARYFDRVIRDVREYQDTLRYMHMNPVIKGLVTAPGEWPWSSFHSFGDPGPVRLKVDNLNLPADETARL